MSYGYLSPFCLTQPVLPFRFKVVSALAEIQRQKGKIKKKKSAERRAIKRYSQVFVILIDIMQLQNVRVLY